MSGLRFERRGAVARLVLDRPDAGNAIDLEMARALLAAADRCDEDEGIRCVILAGAGRFFCLGGDVASFAAAGDDVSLLIKQITGALHMAIARLARMNKPLITEINGTAAGAGLSLAALGDIAIASQGASFLLAYGGLGFTPDGGATWLLPRLIGLRQTQKLAFTQAKIDAAEAERIGLITESVEPDRLRLHVQGMAERMVSSAPSAVGPIRALLAGSFQNSLETQMELEARQIAAASRSPYGREGIAAFTEKRPPDFGK